MRDGKSANPVWKYERTFAFDLPISRAWSLFTDPAETKAWLLPFEEGSDGRSSATIDGLPPVEMKIEQIDPPKLIRVAMSGGNIPDHVETTTTLEETRSGTKVTLSMKGSVTPRLGRFSAARLRSVGTRRLAT